jgi:translation initiation factor 2B subunit (eIF-2B alpha/beta/delta family)
MEIIDDFKHRWDELNARYEVSEPFPDYVSEYAYKIKEFMKPENRKYQGALGNSRGMLDAVLDYANKTTIDNIERFKANIEAIFEFLMRVRQTSQVPLNTTFFINQKLKKLPEKNTNVDLLKEVLKDECEFHVKNYKRARDRIANTMSSRIIDRCEEYNIDNITIGTHCHSGAVVDAIIKSKKYVKEVIVSKTEPEQQGVLTAQDLCKAGIKVNFINLEQYGTEFRKVNMFLFGIDAVSVEGIVLNKAGTRMIATIARTKELPVYFLGETYKYARNTLFGGLVRIERRDVAEKLIFNHLGVDLTPYVESGLLGTHFQAFDTTRPEFYDSIVSEQGFLPMREAFEREWATYL